MWWEVVFPSLLPFFITAELLIGFGIVQYIGALFEPIMRPLFNVPGVGSFAWIMGMASGYPSGAKISVRLRDRKSVVQGKAAQLFVAGGVKVKHTHHSEGGPLLTAVP